MTTDSIKWFWYASPQTFFPLAGTIARVCAVLAAILTVAGLYIGFFVAPTDAQQGEVYRVIFIHVPAAWLSMFIYVVMACWAALGLAFNTRLSGMMASALAPTGALFTVIALWTGSLWGRPTWGTYWVWDARLTSELILLFLYLGFIALQVLTAFEKNLVFFFSPTQVAAKEAPVGRTFRIGGIVEPGSIKRDGVEVRFIVTDTAQGMPVVYRGALPDLFREGKMVV